MDPDEKAEHEALAQSHWYAKPLATVADRGFGADLALTVQQFADIGWALEFDGTDWWATRARTRIKVVLQSLFMGRSAIIDAHQVAWYAH